MGGGLNRKTHMHTKRVSSELYICEHGFPRTTCREGCGGGSICEHGRRRDKCKVCGKHSFCEHGKRRSDCKRRSNCGGMARGEAIAEGCGGGSICEHGIPRTLCKEGCGGGSICEHGKTSADNHVRVFQSDGTEAFK